MSIIKRLFCRHEWGFVFCRHEWEFVRNIYGDEINLVGGCRSWWRCKRCGKRALDPYLYEDLENRGYDLGTEVDE